MEKSCDGMKVHVSRDPMVSPVVYDTLDRIKVDMDKFIEEDIQTFTHNLVRKYGLFQSERDIKLFLLEAASKELLNGDIDFPIKYYKPEEDIPKDKKVVETGGVAIDTDPTDYVNKME